jgi:hypothetical protein
MDSEKEALRNCSQGMRDIHFIKLAAAIREPFFTDSNVRGFSSVRW